MIKIMVDSGSDSRMDSGLCDFHIPLTVSIGGKDYLDGQNLTADRFYELLTATEEFPKTSQPSPEMFLESFENAKEAAD
jgi:fatty acid-binding protein DegV